MSTSPQQFASAATDVSEFLSDLDAGVFERKLSVALSQAAAAVVDHDKAGEVTVKFSLKKIAGTSQVSCSHLLKFSRPTSGGKVSEEDSRDTVLHVGKNGRLSLVPETQTLLFETKPSTTQQA